MFQLRVLGRTELVDPEGNPVRSVLNQPKRVAFLAHLAANSGMRAPREALVDLFWPGVDRDRGRHSLSQCLYYLRRSLGKNALLTDVTAEVRLCDAHVWADVRAFRQAAKGGRLQEALELYRGDFLEGASLPELTELERWIDEQRLQLRARAARAASALAADAADTGGGRAACRWARRAVDLAPYEERPLRQLMELLSRAGERAKALAEYQRFEEDLRGTLGAEPSEETVALATALRKSQALGGREADLADVVGGRIRDHEARNPDVRSGSPWHPESRSAVEDYHVLGKIHPEAVPRQAGRHRRTPERSGGGGGSPDEGGRVWAARFRKLGSRFRSRGWMWPARVGAAVLVLAMALLWLPSTPEAVPRESWIAVFPFQYHGSERYEYLGAGIAELVTISLGGLDQIRTVDPLTLFSAASVQRAGTLTDSEGRELARRFGAEHFVTGTLVEAGGRIQVTATIHSVERGVVGSLHRRIEDEGRVFDLVDDLVRGFIAEEYLVHRAPLASTAAMATGSLPALKAFLRGEELFRTGHHHRALEFLREAVELDPSFALAHYRAGVVSLWTGSDDFDAARLWIRGALAEAHRLPERDRVLIRALDAFLHGDGTRAERLYREALVIHPENLEAWLHLGEVLYHYGPLMGRDVVASRHAWEQVLALDPRHRGGLTHLAAVAAAEGDVAELERMVHRLADLDGTPGVPVHVLALHASATEDPTIRAELLERLREEPVRIVRQAASYASLYLYDLEFASTISGILTEGARPPSERAEGHLWLAHLNLGAGRVERAEEEFALARRLDPERTALERTMLAAVPEAPVELWALAEAGDPRWTEDPPGVPVVVDLTPRPALDMEDRSPASRSGSEALAHFHVYLDALLTSQETGLAEPLVEAASRLEAEAEGHPGLLSLSRGLQAQANLLEGDPGQAMERLRQAMHEAGFWYERIRRSPLHSLARERFLLAELLTREGELEEAIRWYSSLVRSSLGEVPFLVASRFRLAELHHALGDTAKAGRQYEHVVRLWDNPDPELEPIVAEARARLARLQDRQGANDDRHSTFPPSVRGQLP